MDLPKSTLVFVVGVGGAAFIAGMAVALVIVFFVTC
jgi:hypothetical protein